MNQNNDVEQIESYLVSEMCNQQFNCEYYNVSETEIESEESADPSYVDF
jgi:hypothetical protein